MLVGGEDCGVDTGMEWLGSFGGAAEAWMAWRVSTGGGAGRLDMVERDDDEK